jgi:hypothetical protein
MKSKTCVCEWRRANRISWNDHIDTLCHQPEVVISSDGRHGIDVDAITTEHAFRDERLEVCAAVREFVAVQ